MSGQRHFIRRTYIETGGGINLSYFDVGGGSPGLSIGGSVLFDLHPQWRLGPNVGFHRTSGIDEGTPNANREYAYRSNLNEISIKGVFVIRFKQYPLKKWKRKLEPRIFASMGILQVQSLQNQNLSGNSSDDKLSIAPVFSIGLGLAYAIKSDFLLALEGASNFSTSDFLEGYTNLNFSTSRDMFHSMLLKIIYKLPIQTI